jgi:hypothetical protein
MNCNLLIVELSVEVDNYVGTSKIWNWNLEKHQCTNLEYTHIKYHLLYKPSAEKKDLVGANVDDSSGNSLLVHHGNRSFGIPFVTKPNKTASTLLHFGVLDIPAMAESFSQNLPVTIQR